MTNCLAKRDLDAMDLSHVDDARKNEILQIKDSIVFNYDATQDFASAASKNLTEFSSDLLKTVKMKDAPDVENLMTELLTNIEKVDATTLQAKKPTFIQKLFGTDSIKAFIRSYEDVETVIHGVRDKLEVANFELKKDIVTGERLLQTNLSYINTLDNHIMACKIRAQEEQMAIYKAR